LNSLSRLSQNREAIADGFYKKKPSDDPKKPSEGVKKPSETPQKAIGKICFRGLFEKDLHSDSVVLFIVVFHAIWPIIAAVKLARKGSTINANNA